MPRNRDRAWHAVLVTAQQARARGARTFTTSDVHDTVDDLGLDVTDRTLRRTVAAMTEFGYLYRVKHGVYQPSFPLTDREFADTGEEVANAY
jgi:predicted transcriptional regulator of viral defense system